MTTMIEVTGLGKTYRLGGQDRAFDTFRDAMVSALTRPFRRRGASGRGGAAETIDALRGVSFTVDEGEVVGLVGRNGAGKSTLLKILSRITRPSAGRAALYGRVGSLLEVGTGFHPELTGRENIFLSGTILGMRRAEVRKKFDAIVAFAGIGRFLDTPVKHYSSGMHVRLGFAVAAHLEPEILLVDEVLAVGDAAFQKKCLGKMDEVSRAGRTVIFVSHNMTAVRSLCPRALWIDEGALVRDGPAGEVVDAYLRGQLLRRETGDLAAFRRDPDGGTGPIRIRGIRAEREAGSGDASVPVVASGEDVRIVVEVDVRERYENAFLTLHLRRISGERIAMIWSPDQGRRFDLAPPGGRIVCTIRNLPLAPGDYVGDIGLNNREGQGAPDYLVAVPLFTVREVASARGLFPNRQWGAVHWDEVAWEFIRA